MMRRVFTLSLALIVGGAVYPAGAEVTKASEWVGRVVVTTGGELLGRIEDMAIEDHRVAYYVVSIGSFLIDDNLIAVDPDALGASTDGRYLVVYSEDLADAQRFGSGSWPATADVMPSSERVAVMVSDEVEAEDETGGFEADRVATISDGRRTATLKPGERTALIEAEAETEPASPVDTIRPKTYRGSLPSDPVVADSEFERLDEDGDGYLSRREIGPRLQRDVRYGDYDLDGNDGIDQFEYQVLKGDA